jgi:hypothetical protein
VAALNKPFRNLFDHNLDAADARIVVRRND